MVLSIGGNVLSKISFCDKQCSNINDNKAKSAIIEELDTKYSIAVVTRDYTIINPNNLKNVSYHQHIITPFTNGNPYMLYLKKIDGINCAIYIDKKLKDGYTYPKMHCVKYRFDDSLFDKETVFTGELVRDGERRWFFLIDNILIYKGMSTNEKNIISRFELIHNILNNEYSVDSSLEICPIQVKKLFLYKDIKKMVEEYIPNLSYVCKGIVFYTMSSKHCNYAYIMPRDNQLEIKSTSQIDEIVEKMYPELWKKKNSISSGEINIPDAMVNNNDSNSIKSNINNNENGTNPVNGGLMSSMQYPDDKLQYENNVVFRILKTDIPDIYNLYMIDDKENNMLSKYAIALVPNLKTSKMLYEKFKENPNNITLNAECKYSKVFEKWTPIRFVNIEPFTKSNIIKIENLFKDQE